MLTGGRPIAGRTDHELVSAVRAGDDRSFEELFARYGRRITAYVQGMVSDYGRAEDITQEVFVAALRRMRQTERPIAFRPWIYEIAKNACIDAFRRRSRAEEVSLNAGDGLGDGDHLRLVAPAAAPEAAVEAKQRLDHLCGAFGGLSDAHHEILVLRELEGHSYREIGDRMGLSRPAVESTLFRARRRLTQEYDELASGARCARVQDILSSDLAGELSGREQRRMARHVAACHECRRHARSVGVAPPAAGSRRARRLAGLLPLPLVGRRREGDVVAAHAHGSGLMTQVSSMLPAAEPLAGSWAKAAATLATLALAGFGAGSVTQHGGGLAGKDGDGGRAVVHRLAGEISSAALAATTGLRQTGVPGVSVQVRSGSGAGPGAGASATAGAGGSGGGGHDERDASVVAGSPGSGSSSGGGTHGAAGGGGDGGSAGDGPGVPDVPSRSLPSAQSPDPPSAPPTKPPDTSSARSPHVEAPSVEPPPTPDPDPPPTAPTTQVPKGLSAGVSAPETPPRPDTPNTSAASEATKSLPSVPLN
jgi:RNA polymerase sigma factor (sigma-70 family)